MPYSVTSRLEDRSRLARVLSDLTEQNLLNQDANIAERLGHLVGVSGSMKLARSLRLLPEIKASGQIASSDDVQALLFSGREQIMRKLIVSFETDHQIESQNPLPSVASGLRVEALKSFEPYQRFYSIMQVEVGVAIKTLRQRIRQAIATSSTDLHQLAVLDHIVEESLEAHTRKLFNVLPKVLEKRFYACRARYHDLEIWDGSDTTWLKPFYQDMRELLLAEFDMRFQPLLGLVEAHLEHNEDPYE